MFDQPLLPGAGQILLGALVAIAAIFDIRYRRIPNWLVLAGILVGLGWNISSSGWSGLARASEGLGLGFILYFPLYLLRARGAGDVKLLAAVGAVTGPWNCLWIFMLTAVLGGVIAVILLMFRGRVRQTFFNVGWIIRDILHLQAPYRSSEELDVTTTKGLRLPHGAMIAVGVLAFIFIARRGINI
ncbi:MAG TPA: prepilin peptidase [Bryobacteraceae bacterium]|jgi:prepilin peptidase CpaA|nr:prepilin peptidase [Bryobacteraceae bacterium]